MRQHIRLLMCMSVLIAGQSLAASLPEPRIGKSPGVSRIVLDLPDGATYSLELLGAALRVTFPEQSFTPLVKKIRQPELSGFTLENGSGNAILTLVTPQGVSSRSGYRESVLPPSAGKTGSRLVLDFSGAYADLTPLQPTGLFTFQKAIGTRFTAVIDPGHGGKDPGARGAVTEEPLNLEVAKRVTAQLQAVGVEVQLTRTNSGTLSNDKALDLASRAAQSRGKSVFVSIHANARPPKNANTTFGTEVYYFSPDKIPNLFPVPIMPEPLRTLEPTPVNAITGGLEKLGEALQVLDETAKPNLPGPPNQIPPPAPGPESEAASEPAQDPSVPTTLEPTSSQSEPDQMTYLPLVPTNLANNPERAIASQQLALSVLSHVIGTTAGFNGGARNADYYVIKQSECPAILVEMGYVTHPVEGAQLKDSNYLDRLAYGISYGVLEYLENATAGF
jgi:N-acetylmuramoyl-L-alanine amidase